jgi:hypothetical protein
LSTAIAATAAAISTTAASTATTESTTTTAAASSTLRCLVNTDSATIELDVVHGVDSGLGISLRSITDESKATAATGVTVLDNNGLLDGSELLELLAKSVLVCVPSEATDE